MKNSLINIWFIKPSVCIFVLSNGEAITRTLKHQKEKIMATVQIKIKKNEITATPIGFDKNIKAQFAAFGGAQKPWKWNGEEWVIEGESKVEYWAERVKGMFSTWKINPSEITDAR